MENRIVVILKFWYLLFNGHVNYNCFLSAHYSVHCAILKTFKTFVFVITLTVRLRCESSSVTATKCIAHNAQCI